MGIEASAITNIADYFKEKPLFSLSLFTIKERQQRTTRANFLPNRSPRYPKASAPGIVKKNGLIKKITI